MSEALSPEQMDQKPAETLVAPPPVAVAAASSSSSSLDQADQTSPQNASRPVSGIADANTASMLRAKSPTPGVNLDAPVITTTTPDAAPAASPPSTQSHAADVVNPTDTTASTSNSRPVSMSMNSGTSQSAAPPKKPTLTHRLTRMFSTQGKLPKENDSAAARDATASNSSTGGAASAAASASGTASGSTSNRPVSDQFKDVNGASLSATLRNGLPHRPGPPSRVQSYADGKRPTGSAPGSGSASRRQSSQNLKKDSDKNDHVANRRFELLPDGAHQHTLKSAKRQEKLSGMLRDMLGGGKKRDEHGGDDHQQLSLMSTWVDQLRSERDRLASDKKGGPNSTATLVQKYGKCQEIVGRGAFGIVRISHKTDPNDNKVEQLFAVKEFRRRPQESPKKYQKRLTSEFCISSSLRHPNVIHTLDLLQDAKGDYCEIMEFCPGGDLYTLILAAGKLEVVEADCYFKQLMCGVEYLHEMGVAHRDLKPENLLLTTHGSLKITDFGNGECFRMAWEKEAHMTAGLCGSAPYIAPEEYTNREFDPRAVDVWATGVIYMAMRTGRHLWRVAKRNEDEFFDRYIQGRKGDDGYGPIETLHRARCRNVIYSILDPDPSPKRRLSASKVLKSEWVRDIRLCKAAEEGF